MDATERDHILFGGSSGISCITQTNCLENEICVKSGDQPDVGVCQCSIGFKRNIEGIIIFFFLMVPQLSVNVSFVP